ncbi:MAG TPA: N-dimethylarginine dimethylaminohydrolase [Kineosporiaceae bacterium]|nr:N-dimethylarginine dimethylaminohydrolase [Kineosporiaceae bacterium]
MTTTLSAPRAAMPRVRSARPRRYLMCAPTHFAVEYAINPWMSLDAPVDRDRAIEQWDQLRRTYLGLGHRVDLIEPIPGLPDMVFAANGGLVLDGVAMPARFRHAERVPEGPAYREWLRHNGFRVFDSVHVNEGEGDFLVAGDRILAGTGFRTHPEAHDDAQELLGLPVISLQLIDPRFYHLDTALAVLDEGVIAYYPGAFSTGSQAVLRRMYPDAILADAADALVLGLNAVSDGANVVLPAAATGLAERLRGDGFRPVPVDLSELLKAGGGPKCCTLELR